MRIKTNSILYLLALLLTLSYPINRVLFLNLRIADIFIFVLVASMLLFNKFKASKQISFLFTIFWFCFFASILGGLFFGQGIDFKQAAFIYKYSLILLIPGIISSAGLAEKHLKRLSIALFFTYIVLVFYVFVHIFLVMSGRLVANIRPSFPFTEHTEFSAGGSHLYSSYIATGLIAIFYYLNFMNRNINIIIRYFILCVSVISLIMTSARGGVLIASIMILIIALYEKLLNIKSFLKLGFAIMGLYVIVSLFYENVLNVIPESLLKLPSRALYYDFSTDQSILRRIEKMHVGFSAAEYTGWVFGIGILASPLIWYDSTFANFVANVGLIGLSAFMFAVFIVFKKLKSTSIANRRENEYKLLLYVSITYFLTNLVTEFFLVTRSVVPFGLFFGILMSLIRKKRDYPTNLYAAKG